MCCRRQHGAPLCAVGNVCVRAGRGFASRRDDPGLDTFYRAHADCYLFNQTHIRFLLLLLADRFYPKRLCSALRSIMEQKGVYTILPICGICIYYLNPAQVFNNTRAYVHSPHSKDIAAAQVDMPAGGTRSGVSPRWRARWSLAKECYLQGCWVKRGYVDSTQVQLLSHAPHLGGRAPKPPSYCLSLSGAGGEEQEERSS